MTTISFTDRDLDDLAEVLAYAVSAKAGTHVGAAFRLTNQLNEVLRDARRRP